MLLNDECSGRVMSGGQGFTVLLSSPWVYVLPVLWSVILVGGDKDVSFILLLSTCCPVEGLCVNCHLLQEDASLVRVELCNDLYVIRCHLLLFSLAE